MQKLARKLGVAVAALVLVALSAVAVAGQEDIGTVLINQGGTGQGTVTSDPAGIDCTLGFGDPIGTCEATFPAGTRVKLKAVAADSSRFVGWAPVNSCPKPKSFSVEAGAQHVCAPVFEFRDSQTFLLQVPIEGSYTVTSRPAGIDCTRDIDAGTITGVCTENVTNGITVILRAVPLAGWVFVGFSGEDPDCADGMVVVDALTRCVATFVRG